MRGLPRLVKESLQKARDSALLAVEDYNKPGTSFKSGAYVVLMTIAWTSLFHAIFFEKGTKPYYRNGEHGHYRQRDGAYRRWELGECLSQFYGDNTGDPVRKNLELFVPLRNEFEHRGYPELDADLFGECQSMLLNFDELIDKEFGSKWSLHESLSFSLQLFGGQSVIGGNAVIPNPDTKRMKGIIETYRSGIPEETWRTGRYSFKAFLVQVANHDSKDALAVQFVDYDRLSDEQRQNIIKQVALVKTRQVPIANLNKLKLGEVVARVQSGLGNPKVRRNGKDADKIVMDVLVRCWKKYKVRPPAGDPHPENTISQYCTYDEVHKDYCYTEAYVAFLIGKLSNEGEHQSLYL